MLGVLYDVMQTLSTNFVVSVYPAPRNDFL